MTRVYNDMMPGPTIMVQPGDRPGVALMGYSVGSLGFDRNNKDVCLFVDVHKYTHIQIVQRLPVAEYLPGMYTHSCQTMTHKHGSGDISHILFV